MAAFNFHRRRTRRWWIGGTITAALAAAILLLAASASGTLTGGTFDASNGDLTSTTKHDWNPAGSPSGNLGPIQTIACPASAPGSGTNCGLDLTNSSSDNALGQGTKEDDLSVSVVDGSIPPQKDDLSRFYINQEVATASGGVIHTGDNLLYLAWERTNLLGSAHMDFELNQNPVGITPTTAGSATLTRTAGDVLIDFDFGGSGVPVLQWHKWLTTGSNASADCAASTTYPCWSVAHSIGSAGEASVNGANVTDNNPPNNPITLQGSTVTKSNSTTVSSTFGEAGIDLQAAGIFTSFACTRFGDAWLKSRSSGSSFVSELKDFIAPLPVNISNCGTIKIIKNTDPRNLDQNFSYTTNVHSGTASNAATFSKSPDTTGTTTTFTLNDKNVAITAISAANPAVVTTSIAHGLTSGQTVTITGSDSVPSIDGPQVVTVIDSTHFSVPVNVTTAGTTGTVVTNEEDITNVPAGSYTVAETLPSGWTLENLSCVPSDNTGTNFGVVDGSNSAQADITVAADGLVTCTYQNKPNLGAILITKTGKDNNCTGSGTPTITNGVCTGAGTAKLGGGTFKVTSDSAGTTQVTGSPVTTKNSTGTVCIDGLSWSGTGTSYYVTETGAPSGYSIDSSTAVQVVVSKSATCNAADTAIATGSSGVVSGTTSTPSFSDTPLTTLEVIATGEAPAGTTKSTISCTHQVSGSPSTVGTSITTPTDPADWKTQHLAPDTYTCTVVIDP
jgi:Prealbumin-like fold domain